jgi:hypothetical protein
MKRILATMVVALATVGATGAAASAGEITGNGNPTPINGYNANSICAFSGLDDMDFEAPVQPGVVQNWGSIPKEIRDMLATTGEHPGTACNGSRNGIKH